MQRSSKIASGIAATVVMSKYRLVVPGIVTELPWHRSTPLA